MRSPRCCDYCRLTGSFFSETFPAIARGGEVTSDRLWNSLASGSRVVRERAASIPAINNKFIAGSRRDLHLFPAAETSEPAHLGENDESLRGCARVQLSSVRSRATTRNPFTEARLLTQRPECCTADLALRRLDLHGVSTVETPVQIRYERENGRTFERASTKKVPVACRANELVGTFASRDARRFESK